MNIVIGSGPAAVSATLALLEKNQKVTMLDVGLTIEEDKRQLLDRHAQLARSEWDAAFLSDIKGNLQPDTSGVPMKFSYGSNFHYRGISERVLSNAPSLKTYCSFAKGGLSNVWGAAVLPYSQDDLLGWPISVETLAPHYKKVHALFRLAGREDELSNKFPLYTNHLEPLKMSRQAAHLLNNLELSKNELHRSGVYFGQARLAVRTTPQNGNPGCVYCGLCLYGCPYRLIYCSSANISEFSKNPNFQYVPGVLVESVAETKSEVIIHGKNYSDNSDREFRGEKVFIGAGALNTAKIILKSIDLPHTTLDMKTSQHFILPYLLYQSFAQLETEDLQTMAQLFVELESQADSRENIHLQIYSYNDLFPRTLRRKLSILYPLIKKGIEKHVLSRLLIMQGYLHSNVSPSLKVSLNKQNNKLIVRTITHPKTNTLIRSAARSLSRHRSLLKGIPLSLLARVSHGGGGAHIGGAFPMSLDPKNFETDLWGRPIQSKNIHIIDASVFPSLPPTTVTYTVMANAYRIASQA